MAKIKKLYCVDDWGDVYLFSVDKIDFIKFDRSDDSIIIYVNNKPFSFDVDSRMKGMNSFDFFCKFEEKLNEEVSDDCLVLEFRAFLNSLLN